MLAAAQPGTGARAIGDRVGLYLITMNAAQLRQFAITFPAVTETIQWGDDRVFKVGGKMFAVSGLKDDSRFSFKVDDERFLELTDRAGVRPAPYLARAKWVQIDAGQCDLPTEDLQGLVRNSYELVFAKLPKKTQREIEQ